MHASEWASIVREHTPLVWRTAYRLLADDADANDCFQEAFFAAWTVAQREPVKNWPGLLTRIATARALNQLRHRRRHRAATMAAIDEQRSTSIDPHADAEAAELTHHLRDALADLPKQHSEAYCLRHLNDFSYEQIATELGMTSSAVGVALHRATARLRAALTPILTNKRDTR
jgi:RNA polymerase sigma-70 factor (ECF subfamily)